MQMSQRTTAARRPSTRRPSVLARLSVESLESRLTPYALTGNAWPNPQLITLSFVPDDTVLAQGAGGPITSNLFSTFNALFNHATAAWQNVILKAAQSWAVQTNINFAVVGDDGSDAGSSLDEQGASNIGDIRIGGYVFGGCTWLASTFYPPPANDYSLAGDITFNTGYHFAIGSTYDLYTVAAHEIGHALGLACSSHPCDVMYATYTNAHSGLAQDDIAGIRAIYSNGSPRAHDAYNTGRSNGTFATATNITATLDPTSRTSVVNNLDITTAGQAEYFTFKAPALGTGPMDVTVQSSGLSLLSPKVTLYAANQTTVLGSASGVGKYGTTLTLAHIAVTPGATYFVKVQGADTSVFGTGRYALTVNLGPGADPTVLLPNTQALNGSPLISGDGVPFDPRRSGGLAGIKGPGHDRAGAKAQVSDHYSPQPASSATKDDLTHGLADWLQKHTGKKVRDLLHAADPSLSLAQVLDALVVSLTGHRKWALNAQGNVVLGDQ
jgi:hypothetical protein